MSDYWLERAKRVAALAVVAEKAGDMELVERHDDEYMRCLFNYYDSIAALKSSPTGEPK